VLPQGVTGLSHFNQAANQTFALGLHPFIYPISEFWSMKTFGANSMANDVLVLWFQFLLRIKMPHTILRQDEQSLTQFFKRASQV